MVQNNGTTVYNTACTELDVLKSVLSNLSSLKHLLISRDSCAVHNRNQVMVVAMMNFMRLDPNIYNRANVFWSILKCSTLQELCAKARVMWCISKCNVKPMLGEGAATDTQDILPWYHFGINVQW
jgi:hypothetical protein